MDYSRIKSKLKKSNNLYKICKKHPTNESKSKYKQYKKKLDELIKIAKGDYYDIILEDASGDTRKIWVILNELINRK